MFNVTEELIVNPTGRQLILIYVYTYVCIVHVNVHGGAHVHSATCEGQRSTLSFGV